MSTRGGGGGRVGGGDPLGGRGRGGPDVGGRGRGGLGGAGAAELGGRGGGGDPWGGRGRGGPDVGGRGRGGLGGAAGAAELGGRGATGGGDRGGAARGGRGHGGGPFHAPQPQPQPQAAGGRGGGYHVVAQGRGQVAAPAPAAVEALSGQMKTGMELSGAPPAGPSSSAPAHAPAAPVRGGGAAAPAYTGGQTAQAVAAPQGRLPPASSKAIVFPARPGYGTVGRKCRVRANHFVVQLADKEIYHYDVTITPESNSRARNRWIINELVKLYKQHMDGRMPVYDGRAGLYTAGPLPFNAKEFVLRLTNPDRANMGEKEYKVAIKDAAKLDMYSLKQFLAGRNRELPQDTIQALDIALRECPTTRYVSISRSFFSQQFGHGGEIGSGVECWRGYYQSLRPTQMGLSLNIDISATAFYKAQPVINFALEYLSVRDPSRRLSDQDRIKLKKALKGVRVVATHRHDMSLRYKITGLTSVPLKDLTFDQDGTRVSVVQYFKRQYNYHLKCIHWPCLQAGSDSRPIYLPMEVCDILEGQRYSRKLNERQVTSILKLACERPAQREHSILEVNLYISGLVVNRNNYGNDYYAKEFGIKLMNQLALVDARVLPPPMLKYHDSGREKECNPSIGQWNMNNKRFINGGLIKNWACVSFASRLHPNQISMFCDNLVGVCNNMGMQVNGRQCVDIVQARPDNLESALRSIHGQSAQVLAQQGVTGQQLELLIVVLPDVNASFFYGRVKRLCETELGVITQCCLPKNVQKGDRQYLQNLALKINVKVGGRNTVLKDALYRRIHLVTDLPTIIFGADVTHPAPGEDASPSIAAVVASMDWPEVSTYRCLVSSQGHRQEIIADLFTDAKDPQKPHGWGMIRHVGSWSELLMSFYTANGRCKPGRIIFYRDGVSEGQFSQVLLYEMDAIRKACASLQDGYLPPVTFVVVQKRHHTRLFPEDHRSRDLDRSGNILPGTVVDTKICHPSEFDFYLCSHSGIQGTSRPTHYHVLFDENHFTADALQTLTYSLCYTYARCTRSVSIVPPAYYAHLAAFRARHYLDDGLSDQEGSSAGSSLLRDHAVPVTRLPNVKENVQKFMFYC
ncbi:hypothetical protein EJB05_05163, partial [Eragrostis curvula]